MSTILSKKISFPVRGGAWPWPLPPPRRPIAPENGPYLSRNPRDHLLLRGFAYLSADFLVVVLAPGMFYGKRAKVCPAKSEEIAHSIGRIAIARNRAASARTRSPFVDVSAEERRMRRGRTCWVRRFHGNSAFNVPFSRDLYLGGAWRFARRSIRREPTGGVR
ncbi:MAG: hypothetical protein IT427_08530 [Pirellulales bacterium]|nr:hypothetical protein [Pirellulales bacterium]